MNKITVLMVCAIGLPACGNEHEKFDPGDKGAQGGVRPAEPAKPAEPPKADDPTASWTEQKGAGFTVMAARAPQEMKNTVDTPLGPQAVTMYNGYQPAGYAGAMQVAVTDLSALKDDPRKPEQIIEDALQGLVENMLGITVDNKSVFKEGAATGVDVTASGTHPQGGPFTLRARFMVAGKNMYMVQALNAKPADKPLVDKFVESFKLGG